MTGPLASGPSVTLWYEGPSLATRLDSSGRVAWHRGAAHGCDGAVVVGAQGLEQAPLRVPILWIVSGEPPAALPARVTPVHDGPWLQPTFAGWLDRLQAALRLERALRHDLISAAAATRGYAELLELPAVLTDDARRAHYARQVGEGVDRWLAQLGELAREGDEVLWPDRSRPHRNRRGPE